MTRAAQVFLTISAIQFGFLPPFADFNVSHIFHEGWLPHARFHTVWALAVGTGLASYVLILLWSPAHDRITRVRYAAAPGCVILTGFFFAVIFKDQFGGALSDVDHPIRFFGFDGNVFAFSIAALVQTAGVVAAWRAG